MSTIEESERLLRIHAICRYLRGRPDEPCQLCPAHYTEAHYGECVKGCFHLAQEVYQIAVYGNPWGERAQESGIKRFRETFNVD